MYQSTFPFDTEFPPLEEYSYSRAQKHIPKAQGSTVVEPYGTKKKISQAEAILNWQTDNMLSQNRVLGRI